IRGSLPIRLCRWSCVLHWFLPISTPVDGSGVGGVHLVLYSFPVQHVEVFRPPRRVAPVSHTMGTKKPAFMGGLLNQLHTMRITHHSISMPARCRYSRATDRAVGMYSSTASRSCL